MKKLFISCPMKGRSEESIMNMMDKMHKIAEIIFNQPLERVKSHRDYDEPVGANHSIYCLGQSISLLAEADYFIGIGFGSSREIYNGCIVERNVAELYDIPMYLIDEWEMLMDEMNEEDDV